MAARRVVNTGTKFWVEHPETYPIIAAVTGAVTFMVYKTTHAAIQAPDVKWTKDRRTDPWAANSNVEEAEQWKEAMKRGSRWNRPGLDVGAVSVFESWFKPARKEGTALEYGPDATQAAK